MSIRRRPVILARPVDWAIVAKYLGLPPDKEEYVDPLWEKGMCPSCNDVEIYLLGPNEQYALEAHPDAVLACPRCVQTGNVKER